MIYYYRWCTLIQKQCIARLISAFGYEAPLKATIYRWFQKFKFSRALLQDEPKKGRRATSVVAKNIDADSGILAHSWHLPVQKFSLDPA